jgi:Ser/Thr protein kinase RdoA (MazF antagonist)
MTTDPLAEVRDAARRFRIEGSLTDITPFKRGHIHDTFVSTWATPAGRRRFLHQRINERVFSDVPGLMHNIAAITRHLDKRAQNDEAARTLSLVRTTDGASYLRCAAGAFRTYVFLEHTESFDQCPDPDRAFEAAHAFGRFQQQLADIDVDNLRETIPQFFNSRHRLRQLDDATEEDCLGRARHVGPELGFVTERRQFVGIMEKALADGLFPRRVVHGDTKLNNVLFDKTNGKTVCVVDLDTCMPGYSLYDFGDLVRFTAATSAEDETDLERCGTDLELYRALVDGYLDTASFLTADERRLMPAAARLVTMTIGMRFLADHLAGDVYFKVTHENHNLDRARVQFAMVDFMERNEAAMRVD